MNKRKIYICPESELRMCEDEMVRTRKNLKNAEINLENAPGGDESAKFFVECENLEMRLKTLQMRHAQLVFSKFGKDVNPFGKIIWRE
jgi:hypothetical protein